MRNWTKPGAAERSRRVRRELAAMTALLLSYIWLWQDAFPGDFVVCLVFYAAIGLSSHLRRGESASDIGFRLDNLLAAGKWALWIVGPGFLGFLERLTAETARLL